MTGDNPAGNLGELVGATLAGRFRLDRTLGRGGYGAVFEGEQVSVGRRCAVKVLIPHIAANDQNTVRFEREARVTSKLAHPNTVVIYDFGLDEERRLLFLAMEYLEGESLRDRIRREGTLDVATTVWIAHQAARSLQNAHDHGLVHRDVKPHNVMVLERDDDPNFVKVIDFGIAKFLGDESVIDSLPDNVTVSGMVIGTPAYMAPEQVRNRPLDGRTDQYALATCVYQMLTGRTVFVGESPVDIATKQLVERPLPLSALRTDLEAVDEVLLRALQKEPDDRFSSIRGFADALADVAGVTLPGNVDTGNVDSGEQSRRGDRGSVGEDATGETAEAGPQHTPIYATAETFDAEEPSVGDGFADTESAELGPDDVPGGTLRVSGPSAELDIEIEDDRPTPARSSLAPVFGAVLLVVGAVAAVGIVAVWPESESAEPAEPVPEHAAVEPERPPPEEPEPAGDAAPVDAAPELEKAPVANREDESSAPPQAPVVTRSETAAQPSAATEVPGEEADPAALGEVTVTLVPWGTLFVDGHDHGDEGRQTLTLPVGEHRLELRQNGETRARKTVDVQVGRNRIVELIAH